MPKFTARIPMKPYAPFVLALVWMIGAGAGCDSLKGPHVTLTTDKTTIAAGGYESATIRAEVKVGGEPASGVEVYFETEQGSFSDSMEQLDAYIATDSEGIATIQLWSPAAQGQTQVQATYYDDETGEEAIDQITITFGPPQAGNLPVDGRFHLDCPYLNLGALRQPKPAIQMQCDVSAQTTNGDNVPTDALNLFFLAEAGVLEAVEDSWSGELVIRYSVQGGSPQPVEVDPIPGEPSRTGSLGGTRNPRDGVVTLLAIAQGSEAWTDLNGNGVRDENEPFTDAAEPYLDVDDNGQYDEGVDEFFDSNSDGEWTDANGQYDPDTFIGATTKVIWSGPLLEDSAAGNEAARLEHDPQNTTIPNGGSLTLSIYLLDKNLNPIAAFSDNYDYLSLDETSGYVTFSPDYEVQLQNEIGLTFDVDGAILEFLPDAGLTTLTVTDYDPQYQNEEPPPQYSISVSYWVTPGPEGDGYWLTQQQGWFTEQISGQVY